MFLIVTSTPATGALVSPAEYLHDLTDFLQFTIQGVPKKMSFSGKTAITNIQTHPKCKDWGFFGKFRIFATSWALRFLKKTSKNGQNSLLSIYID